MRVRARMRARMRVRVMVRFMLRMRVSVRVTVRLRAIGSRARRSPEVVVRACGAGVM